MKKKVFRERQKTRDENGNEVVVLGTEKPEIIPFDEGGFTIDKNGDIETVNVKKKTPKKVKKGE